MTKQIIQNQINVSSMNSNEIIEEIQKLSPIDLPSLQIGNLKKLPSSFYDHDSYKHSFKPLVVEEFKSQFIKSFCEFEGVQKSASNTLLGLDKMKMKESISIQHCPELPTSYQSTNCFFNLRLIDELSDDCRINDLILFKLITNQRAFFVIGRVNELYPKTKVYFPSGDFKELQQCIDCEFMFSPNTCIALAILSDLYSSSSKAFKKGKLFYEIISNCEQFIRELKSLDNIKKSQFFPLILNPDINIHNKMLSKKIIMPSNIKNIYSNSLNKSQMKAVDQSLFEGGISLIQGPPGTGKTNTIYSIISILLSINPHTKILVCAPSNAAVNEVAKRVLSKQLVDSCGNSYLPKMVRTGRGEKISPDVYSIATFKCDNIADEIQTASICFSTLASSASRSVEFNFYPDVVIIDESTQSTEMSTILPLSRKCVKKLILVGDVKQLAPTVISELNKKCGLAISLFERLSKVIPVTMLDTQYRMHPLISIFPSTKFYDGRLGNGDNVKSNSYIKDFHKKYNAISFHDIVDGFEERGQTSSYMNLLEIKLIFSLIKKLIQTYPNTKDYSFGIITPYKLQRDKIEQFEKLNFNYKLDITVNTVDGFQGAEKDIIFYSCVRSESIGFLGDTKRINVSITRAKFGLFIVGNKKVLSTDKTWKPYIEYIDSINCLKKINSAGIKSLEIETNNYDKLNPKGLIKTLSKSKSVKRVDEQFDHKQKQQIKLQQLQREQQIQSDHFEQIRQKDQLRQQQEKQIQFYQQLKREQQIQRDHLEQIRYKDQLHQQQQQQPQEQSVFSNIFKNFLLRLRQDTPSFK